MNSSDKKPCVQERVLNFINTYWRWIIVSTFQIYISFWLSYFLSSLVHPFFIPVDLSNQILGSLIDVFVALFGFVGLILVFAFRNLLTTKGNLQKEKLDTDLKISQLEYQDLDRKLHVPLNKEIERNLASAKEKCVKRSEEINDELISNKKQMKAASYLGRWSLALALACVLMNVLAFGFVTYEGLHFFTIAILLSLLFIWLDVTFVSIRTVID